MDFNIENVNAITNKELSFNINDFKSLLSKEIIDKKAFYLNVVTGTATGSENLFDAGMKIASVALSNPLTSLVEKIDEHKKRKEEQRLNKMNNFLSNLSNGEATLGDYLDYLKEKYKLSSLLTKGNINDMYNLEMRLVNQEITLSELISLNKMKGMSKVEQKVLEEDFINNKSENIIKSSALYTYKESLIQKINDGKVINDNDFKNILKIEGLTNTQINQVFNLSKANTLEMRTSESLLIKENVLKNRLQKNAIEVIQEEKKKSKNNKLK